MQTPPACLQLQLSEPLDTTYISIMVPGPPPDTPGGQVSLPVPLIVLLLVLTVLLFCLVVLLAASLPSANAMMASTGPRDKGMPEGTLPPSVVGKLPDKPPEYQMNKSTSE